MSFSTELNLCTIKRLMGHFFSFDIDADGLNGDVLGSKLISALENFTDYLARLFDRFGKKRSVDSANYKNGNTKKRAVNGQPLYAVTETVAVIDYSNFVAHSGYANTTNVSVVLLNMKMYFAHMFYAVRTRISISR